MSGLGTAMSGGIGTNSTRLRRADDFYPTPPAATIALAREEMPHLAHHRIWEPACGNGEMALALIGVGLDVARSSDLIDRGYGEPGIDFLEAKSLGDCDAIVTNPPFNLAPKFIRHALIDLRAPYLALLLKATFWHAATRTGLFDACTPAAIYPLTWRLDFLGQGAPTMDTMWCVWDRDRGGTTYQPLRKSEAGAAQLELAA